MLLTQYNDRNNHTHDNPFEKEPLESSLIFAAAVNLSHVQYLMCRKRSNQRLNR